MTAVGQVDVVDLNLDFNASEVVSRDLVIDGPGKFNVYHMQCAQQWDSYVNRTKGGIISGQLAGIDTITTGGSIGAQVGRLGTWIHGLADAPVTASPMIEPQYGWYRDKINGLNIDGSIRKLTAGGFIRDVRATGRIGDVVANADMMTPAGQWHGVNGIIWSGLRIDSVAVGDGLADDGPVAKAKAAILSTYTVGSVTIRGPRYVRDGLVFGEINGAIFGQLNMTVVVTTTGGAAGGAAGDLNFPRNPAWIIGYTPLPTGPVTTTTEWDAVGKIIGTEGAQMTALVCGGDLDSFYCFSGTFGTADPTSTGPYTGVGTIRFSGEHALIHGFEAFANYVGSVTATAESDGLIDSWISGNAARPNGYSIGYVGAGGPGMTYVYMSADGGDVGTVEGLASTSDITYSKVVVVDGGIRKVAARDIIQSQIHAPEDVGSIAVSRDMLDMIIATGFDNNSILLNEWWSPGTFEDAYAPLEWAGRWPRSIAVGDLNNDGYPDIVTTNEHAVDYQYYLLDNYVTVILSTAYGYYDPEPHYYIAEAGPRSVAIADINGDGNFDVVVGNYKDDSVTTFFGDGTGDLLDRRIYPVGISPTDVVVADVDGNHVLDLIVPNEGTNDVSVLIGRGNGTFRDQTRFAVGTGPSSAAVGDFDVDGDTDIVVTNKDDDTISILLNNGAGQFPAAETQTFGVGAYPMSVAVGHLDDFNGDGVVDDLDHLDIVVANRDEQKVSVLLGQHMADLDFDGDLDLVFAPQQKLLIGSNPRHVELADLDYNGALDIITANQADEFVTILYGNVDGLGNPDATFAEPVQEEALANVQALAIADMDMDGALDIVTADKTPGEPGLLVGAIGTFTIGHSVVDSYFRVAGAIGRMSVGGTYDNTQLLLPGSAADIGTFEVNSDISGIIESHGALGSIISKTGAIFAHISTTIEPHIDAPSHDIDMIKTALGYWGELNVAGSLHHFECWTTLGVDPRIDTPQEFLIRGDLGVLRVVTLRGAASPSDLFADFSVGGSVGAIDVDGTLWSNVVIRGNLDKLILDGNLGAQFGGELYGSLDVMGEIRSMKFAKSGDLVADIICGGSIQKLAIRDGDLEGNIVSRYGDILGVYVYNGNINGSITGRSISYVAVKAGASNTGNLNGDVTATNGGIGLVYVAGRNGDATTGNLLADVSANNGRVDKLTVISGTFGSNAAKYVASATRGFKKIDIRGDMFADIETEGVIDLLSVRGSMNNLLVGADSGIRKLYTYGNMNNVTARTGGKMDRVYVAGDMIGSTVSAGWDIGTVTVRGNVTADSMVLAGWDVGEDTVSILLGNGAGAVVPQAIIAAGTDPAAVALGDLNGDGAADMVVANRGSDDVTVRLNDGTGGFGTQKRYQVGDAPTAVALGDLDGDGVVDILAVNSADNTLSILLGNGDGSFADQLTANVGVSPQAVAVGQLTDDNGDGLFDSEDDLDVVTANADGSTTGDGSVSILFNFDPTFVSLFQFSVRELIINSDPGADDSPQAVAIGDLDGVNGPDVLIGIEAGAFDSVGVHLNIGTPFGGWSIGTVDYYGVGANPVAVAMGDVSNDGVPDIVVANADDNTVGILPGDGVGGFGAHDAYAVGTAPRAVVVGYINGDRTLDVATANSGSDNISILTNTTGSTPGGILNAHVTYEAGVSPQGMAVADLNSDGDLDIVVANQGVTTNPLTGSSAHSGNIYSMYVGGNFMSSIVAAGIDPVDGDFLTVGDNIPAPGSSTIYKMAVRGLVQDTASSAILADTGIYQKFVDAKLAGTTNLNYTTNFAPAAVETGDGNDFGPSVLVAGRRDVVWQSVDGTFTIVLSGGRDGMAYYDEATKTLTLKQTTASSSVTLRYTGAGNYGTVHIRGVGPDGLFGTADDGAATDDSSIKTIKVIGNVTLGNIDIDGPVRTIIAGAVNASATWNLPGGLSAAKLYGDVANLDVNAGYVRSWAMLGAYGGGTFQADAVGSFYARGNVAAAVDTVLGEMSTFRVYGNYTGQASFFGNVGRLYVYGTFGGQVTVVCGDVRAMYVQDNFTGVLDVEVGEVRGVTVGYGSFGGQLTTAVHAAAGVGSFYVKRGDFSGLLNTDGNIGKIYAGRGAMTGKVRAAGSIQKAYFGSMTNGIAAAGGNFDYVYIYGDMAASSIFAGLDLGYDPYGLPEYNVHLDGETPALWRTLGNSDTARGGSIYYVRIYGDMSPVYDPTRGTWDPYGRASTIAAAVDPGYDGYVGTYDDRVRGTGSVYHVVVYRGIFGNGGAGQSYGVYAASDRPTVYFWRNRIFERNDNASVGTVPTTVGDLLVEDVTPQARSVIVRFNHEVDMGTINTQQRDTNRATTFFVYGPYSAFFDTNSDGFYDSYWDDQAFVVRSLDAAASVSDSAPNKIAWDPNNLFVTMTLTGTGSWAKLVEAAGLWSGEFLLVLDGTQVADPTGTILDGDGDGIPGGDYQFVWTVTP